MAEIALQNIDDHLNCIVCADGYTDPKQLQCHHIFCRKCLERILKRNQLVCPSCRTVTPVPPGGVAGLPSAFNISHLLEILNEHKNTTRYCPEHPTRELESFCETCEKLICLECGLEQHRDHTYDLLSVLVKKYKADIKSSLKPAVDRLEAIQNARDALHLRYEEISQQQVTLEAKIRENARQIQEAAESKKVELINKLRDITKEKLQDLDSQKAEMETSIAQLSSYLESVHKSLETSSQGEVVMMKATVSEQGKKLTKQFQYDLKLYVEADMKISAKANVSQVRKSLGDVFTSRSANPAQCHRIGKGLESATVGENSTLIIEAINYKNESCKNPISSLESELISELHAIAEKCTIRRRGESQYEITYRPTIQGMHQLHIKVNDQHIKGSPFSIEAKLLTFKTDSPNAIAINQSGAVIVAEARFHRVSVFNPCGKKLSFGKFGSGRGEFQWPCGVAMDNLGNILVIDQAADRVQLFSPEGWFLTAVTTTQVSTLQLIKTMSKKVEEHPKAIAFNPTTNRIYFLITSPYNSVHILNSNLTHYRIFGRYEFRSPRSIACDSTGNVLITDENIIKVFTADGDFLSELSNDTVAKWQDIGSLAVDGRDMVYVYNPFTQCVAVITNKGQLVSSFSTQLKDEEKKEYSPGHIAVGKDGKLCLCERNSNIIKVFKN